MLRNMKRNAFALAAGFALAGSAQAFVVNDTFSGNYGEGGGASRGLIISVIEDFEEAGDFEAGVLVQWFTYRDGEPVWLISDGAVVDANSNSAQLNFNEFAGGSFGPGIGSPSSVPWGDGTLTFNSCGNVELEYDGIDGAGTIEFNNRTTRNDECVVEEAFESCPFFATPGAAPGTCVIGGSTILDDITLTNETLWLLEGQVRIADGGSVTIEPNTEIVGGAFPGSIDTFVIQQGGKIFAEGTQANPIVMRGAAAEGRGEWGGLVVNGFAPINEEGGTANGEGDSGVYGGSDPNDNSGVMRYLIVSNAGFEFTEENELNGIALQGVGDGTTFENIQVHLNADDGVEFFGGTVNAKRVVLTGIGDDSIDWTEGWQGNLQYAVIKQYADGNGDQGIEGDNNGGNNDLEPRALPVIANATFIGQSTTDIGWLIREGSGVSIANSIVTGFGEDCVDIDQLSTFDNSDNLTFVNNVIGNCGSPFADNETNDGDFNDPFVVSTFILDQPGNVQADPMLMNYAPMEGSPALNIGAVPYTDSFFDNVDYAGAIPSIDSDWTAGWTVGLNRDVP